MIIEKFIMRSVLRIILVCVMIGYVGPVTAQTSGDKLYSQGLSLQKEQNIKSQKTAISKFQSAKKLYDSAAKKKQCDEAISVSNSIISALSKRVNIVKVNNKAVSQKTSELELSNDKLQLDCESHSVTINVRTTETKWSVAPRTNSDGSSFVSVNHHPDDNNFEVICPENTSTMHRSQEIDVCAGEKIKNLIVEQSGKPVILSVGKTVVEFSSKGSNKSIEVYSNSDSVEKSNNNRNWKIVSKPDWVNVIGEEFKEKGFLGKLGDKAKSLVSKNSANANDSSIVKSVMKIVVASKPKNEDSRSGEIIICSENQQATIIVQQK